MPALHLLMEANRVKGKMNRRKNALRLFVQVYRITIAFLFDIDTSLHQNGHPGLFGAVAVRRVDGERKAGWVIF